MEPLASHGNQLNANTNLSTLISLTILHRNGTIIPIQTTTKNHSFDLLIPRDPNLIIPPMIDHHVTTIFNTSSHHHQQIFHFHYLNVTTMSGLSISIHLEINPLDPTVAYLLVYRFDQLPQLNSSTDQIDGWTPLCPNSKSLSSNTNEREYYGNTIDHKDDSILSKSVVEIVSLISTASKSLPSIFDEEQSMFRLNRDEQ